MLLSQASSEQEAEDMFCAGFLFCLLFTHYNVVLCSETSVNYAGPCSIASQKVVKIWPVGLLDVKDPTLYRQ
jgi:hypothetical protein